MSTTYKTIWSEYYESPIHPGVLVRHQLGVEADHHVPIPRARKSRATGHHENNAFRRAINGMFKRPRLRLIQGEKK